jgi:hypothetical protein
MTMRPKLWILGTFVTLLIANPSQAQISEAQKASAMPSHQLKVAAEGSFGVLACFVVREVTGGGSSHLRTSLCGRFPANREK